MLNWNYFCLGRHYFNLRGRNINKPSILFTSILALVILAINNICVQELT